MTRISIITTSCKRCGKSIASASRSIYGLDGLKAKYDRICSNCMSKEEEAEMNMEMGKQIAGKIINNN